MNPLADPKAPQDITAPEDRIRCRPYGATLFAASCLERQGILKLAPEHRTGDYAECDGCQDGAVVREKLGEPKPTPTPQRVRQHIGIKRRAPPPSEVAPTIAPVDGTWVPTPKASVTREKDGEVGWVVSTAGRFARVQWPSLPIALVYPFEELQPAPVHEKEAPDPDPKKEPAPENTTAPTNPSREEALVAVLRETCDHLDRMEARVNVLLADIRVSRERLASKLPM